MTTKTIVKPARLTKEMRKTFIGAVMADVPAKDYETIIRDAVNKAHRAAVPPTVAKLIAASPEWARLDSYVINHHNDGLPYGRSMTFYLNAPRDSTWLRDVVHSVADPLIKEWVKQVEARQDLERKLHGVAESCNTTTQLAEAFPEFARYLPQTQAEATRNLPALANVVADFTAAGWPKGKKP